MVSAWIAEVTSFEIVVKNPAGSVVLTKRMDLVDEDDPHGVSQDDADEWLEGHGYLVSSFRWQPHGSYYKAVLVTVEDYRRREARKASSGG